MVAAAVSACFSPGFLASPAAMARRTTKFALVLLGAVAACASLAFTLAPSRPMSSNLPQHARPAMPAVADGTPLLGPRGLMRLVSCNKTGLMLMMVFSVAVGGHLLVHSIGETICRRTVAVLFHSQKQVGVLASHAQSYGGPATVTSVQLGLPAQRYEDKQ